MHSPVTQEIFRRHIRTETDALDGILQTQFQVGTGVCCATAAYVSASQWKSERISSRWPWSCTKFGSPDQWNTAIHDFLIHTKLKIIVFCLLQWSGGRFEQAPVQYSDEISSGALSWQSALLIGYDSTHTHCEKVICLLPGRSIAVMARELLRQLHKRDCCAALNFIISNTVAWNWLKLSDIAILC